MEAWRVAQGGAKHGFARIGFTITVILRLELARRKAVGLILDVSNSSCNGQTAALLW